MENDKILICLEQKEILVTRTFNITKQLEAKSRQPEIHFGDLPQQRQAYIDRLKKCETLLSSYISGLPADEGARIKKILSGDIRQRECTESEQKYCEDAAHIHSMLGGIVAMDNEILRNTKRERDRQQKLIKRLKNEREININKYYK